MGVLCDRMIEEMKLRNVSPATQESLSLRAQRRGPPNHRLETDSQAQLSG